MCHNVLSYRFFTTLNQTVAFKMEISILFNLCDYELFDCYRTAITLAIF